jgi:hypothetical protein
MTETPKTVWMLDVGGHYETEIEGVFSTKEAALAALRAHIEAASGIDWGHSIIERLLDKSGPGSFVQRLDAHGRPATHW